MIGRVIKFCPEQLDWESFQLFIAKYRDLEVEEVENYREEFNTYDKDKSGDISLKELMPLLKAVGKEPRSVLQRAKLQEILGEIDQDGSGEISFPEFLQLMRRFLDEADAEQMRKEKDVVNRTDFSPEEVSSWRSIFLKFDEDESGEFDQDEAKKLLRAVGITLNDRQMYEHFAQIFAEVDEDESGSMDFPEFLLLMRKLINIDFGGVASRVHQPKKQNKRARNRQSRTHVSYDDDGDD